MIHCCFFCLFDLQEQRWQLFVLFKAMKNTCNYDKNYFYSSDLMAHPFMRYLQSIQQTGPDTVIELIDIFNQETDSHCVQLRNCLKAGNSDGVYFISHKIMSTSLLLKNDFLTEKLIFLRSLMQQQFDVYVIGKTTEEIISMLHKEKNELNEIKKHITTEK